MSESVLLHGDCLQLMKDIPDKTIGLVLTDPPYGTTEVKWKIYRVLHYSGLGNSAPGISIYKPSL